MYKKIIAKAVLSCLLCSFLFSCKKKDSIIPSEMSFPFTEKMFYCQSNSTTPGNYSLIQTTGDIVIPCYVENDSLKILDYTFPIKTDNQSFFEIDCSNDVISRKLTVYFLNNHDSISIHYTESYLYSGFFGDRFTYIGVATELQESTQPHAYSDDLKGLYVLDVTHKNSCLGIDTFYTDTLQVNIYKDSIIFGTYNLPPPPIYHSHSEYNYNSDAPVFEQIYWKEDSVRYYRLLPQNSFFCVDTILHIFQGRKL